MLVGHEPKHALRPLARLREPPVRAVEAVVIDVVVVGHVARVEPRGVG
jgi:hypothetical protein